MEPITLKQIEIIEKYFISNDSEYFKAGVYKPKDYIEWKKSQDKEQMRRRVNLLSKREASEIISCSVNGEFKELMEKWEALTQK